MVYRKVQLSGPRSKTLGKPDNQTYPIEFNEIENSFECPNCKNLIYTNGNTVGILCENCKSEWSILFN